MKGGDVIGHVYDAIYLTDKEVELINWVRKIKAANPCDEGLTALEIFIKYILPQTERK